MNYQNIDKNPHAPPKSALDFGLPEKGTKKQRIIRILIGALSMPVLFNFIALVVLSITNQGLVTKDSLFLLFIICFVSLIILIIPSLIFSSITEFFCPTWSYKIVVALVAGAIPFCFLPVLGIAGIIFGEIAAFGTIVIMHILNKHYQQKHLT